MSLSWKHCSNFANQAPPTSFGHVHMPSHMRDLWQGGGGGMTRSRARITADLAVFLCIENHEALCLKEVFLLLTLGDSWGQVEACNTKNPLEPQHLGGV